MISGEYLLKDLEPDVFRPVRRDRGKHQGLELNIPEDEISVYTNSRSRYGLTV
jgi:hypothetical protein